MLRCVPVIEAQQDHTAGVYLHMLEKITSVTQHSEAVPFLTVLSILMIHSGMVRDVGVPAPAVVSTIRRGSAGNSLSQLLMTLS